MSRSRSLASALVLAVLVATPATAQAPQFRADVSQTGDTPFEGTMYFGNGRMRIEGMSDGQQVTMIIDSGARTMMMLMPEDRMYMTMDLGSAPFSAPGATPMDPANPCSSGEISDCRSLGNETVNGYAARGWEYTRDGERETAWIANELRFPVRTVDADGNTTDLTNVAMGPQPSSLFEPPAGYTAMAMPGFGGGRGLPPGGRGRGQVPPGAPPAGRGAVPPGAAGRGAPAGAPAGVDPAAAAQLTAQLQAMGLPPDQIAMALAQLGAAGTVTNSAPWETGDGWIADLVVTASHSESTSTPDGRTVSVTYSARFTGSVPFTYGTPAVGAAMGPAWQLVPGTGSPLAEAQRITFSGTSEARVETITPQMCPVDEGGRSVAVHRATGSADTNDQAVMLLAQARWEIAGDLSTHTLSAGVAAVETAETIEITNTVTRPCPGSEAQNTTEQRTREPQMAIQVNLAGLPLAASPGVMRGSARAPMQFDVAGSLMELDANVEWTLRPIS